MAARYYPITFVDVETTGLSHGDRVVSLGLVHFQDNRMLETGDHSAQATHLIFNPGRPSHPRARKVHGYSDEELGWQESFAEHASDLRKYFEHDGVVVAHNASFDRRFIANEFRAAGHKSAERDYFCTMLAHRRKYGSGSGLDVVLTQMGKPARRGKHGALEDAWRAAEVYSWLHGLRALAEPEGLTAKPLNYRNRVDASVVVPVPPVTAPPAEPPISAELVMAKSSLEPLATLMMAIARADGDFSIREVETMSLYIHTRLEAGAIKLSGDDYLDLLDHLCGIGDGAIDLLGACRRVLQSASDREEMAWWIRQITFADGSGSPAEQAAIENILATVRNLRAERAT